MHKHLLEGETKMNTKTNRTVMLIDDTDMGLLLKITEKFPRKEDQVTWYQLARNPNDSQAWNCLKLVHSDEEPVGYDVHLGDKTCDCKGGTAHGHCRHLEALLALKEAGKLP